MKTYFRDIKVLTMDKAATAYDHGYVVVDGARIAYVSDVPYLGEADEVIDGANKVLVPGLINCHQHISMSLLRGEGGDLPLMRWLTEAIWPKEDNLTDEAVYWGTMLGIAEQISMGVTTFNDMYFFLNAGAQACLDAGMRTLLCRGLMDPGGNAGNRLEENEDAYKRWHGAGDGLIRIGLGPHAEYTCSEGFLKQCIELGNKLDAVMHVHVSETKSEVEQCIQRHGKSPVKYLNDLGMFDRKAVAAHCVWVDDEDMDILAAKGVGVSHNPTSNLKLGSGIAPVARMLEKGVIVGLGTDGVASNNNTDIWKEMTLAALLQKGTSLDPSVLPVDQILPLATSQGARALGWDDEIGSIEEGKLADMAMFNIDTPVMTPATYWKDNLVYAAKSNDVVLTMIQGKIVYRDGQFTTMDIGRVKARAAEEAAKL